jgi:hypothetical protein
MVRTEYAIIDNSMYRYFHTFCRSSSLLKSDYSSSPLDF